MIDRNAEILRNKLEVLERRKAQLLSEIADKQAEVANLSTTFAGTARSTRIQALVAQAPPGEGAPGVRSRERDRPGQVGPVSTGFKYGLIISLVIGIILVIFAK